MEVTNISLEIFAAIVVFFLMVGCIQFKSIYDYASNLFIIMQVWNLIMLLCDAATWTLIWYARQGYYENIVLQRVFACGIYIAYYMMMRTFIRYVCNMVQPRAEITLWLNRAADVVCITWALLWCISAFNDMFCEVCSIGVIRSQYFWVGQLGGYFCVIVVLYLVFVYWRNLGRDAFFLLSFVLFPFLSSLLHSKLSGISLMDLAMTLSSILIYNFVHVGAARAAKEQQVVLGETQMKLMTSQIQPHFIFNSLNTIYYLVEKDPAMAQCAISTFSDYLRGNINSIQSTDLQPFDVELKHVKSYLELEKMRFSEELEIAYDIQVHDFILPALSLQPIVENAVKHGVGKKAGGGKVTIRTYEDTLNVYIEVADDGVGFQTDASSREGGHMGVGMENVVKRLKYSCNGKVNIRSTIGKGTTVQLVLPKDNAIQSIQLES